MQRVFILVIRYIIFTAFSPVKFTKPCSYCEPVSVKTGFECMGNCFGPCLGRWMKTAAECISGG